MSLQRDVWAWLMTCPVFPRLFYAFSLGEDGDVQLSPIGGVVKEEWLTRYLNESGQKYLDYEVAQFLPAPVIANSDENVSILETFAKIAEWIDEQSEEKNYPFAEVTGVELLNTGMIAARDESGAKYTFQFRVRFFKQ